VFNQDGYLESVTGLDKLQKMTDELDLSWDEDDKDDSNEDEF
jgi:hypothetical protein